MASVTLYCKDTPGLKLGPGGVEDSIIFVDGFASVDPDRFPDWEAWVNHRGTPTIEVLPEDSSQVPDGSSEFTCDICGRSFSGRGPLSGHLKSHAPKAAKA